MLCAVRLVLVLALSALQACIALGADTNSRALLDETDFGSDTNGLADDFYTHERLVARRLWLHIARVPLP